MAIPIDEYMKRLEEISYMDGIPFARAHFLFDAEHIHEKEILKYKGYLALSDAFKCFFLRTIEDINGQISSVGCQASSSYILFVPYIVHGFISICGSERVSVKGYPYQGYTLLRNVFDNLILVSASLQGITDFYRIAGVTEGQASLKKDEIKKLRKKEEQRVRDLMTGRESRLSDSTISELAFWDSLFDMETHGGRLSATQALNWMKGLGPLPVLPSYEEQAFGMFMNRFTEMAWMLFRLLPTLQIPEAPLSEQWRSDWKLLDECFEQAVGSLTEQLGKKIGAAIVELVRCKFPFSPDSTFPL